MATNIIFFFAQLNNLKTRAGVETMLFTTRGTTDMPLRAVAFATDGVENFLEGVIKTDTQDSLGKMEGFAVQGVKDMNISSKHFALLSIILGAARNHQQCVSAIRADIWNEISEALSKFIR